MYDVITFGGASWDIFFKTKEGTVLPDPKGDNRKFLGFLYGSKVMPDEIVNSFGGGAFNTAVCFSKFGLKTAATIRVGNDSSADYIKKRLKNLGISCEYLEEDENQNTALSFLVTYNNEHVAFLERGASDFLEAKKIDQMKAKWFYIASLTGSSDKILDHIFEKAEKENINIAFNPGSCQIEKSEKLKRFIEKTDILIVNREEACEIIENSMLEKSGEVRFLGKELVRMGAKKVVITDGADGSYYFDNHNFNYQKASPAGVEETTGAGDAFASTFVASVIQGKDFKTAQKYASINSASVVEKIGAQNGLLTDKELKSKIKKKAI